MITLRLIVNLRSLLLTNKCGRIASSPRMSLQSRSPMVFTPYIPVEPQQICSFSSSAIVHARREDQIDSTVTEDFEEEDDADSNQSEQEKLTDSIQQYKLPKGYRIIIRHLASLRLDLICSAGTGLGRSAIENEFYGAKLRVNGEKSSKKAQQVKEGDVIDLIVSRAEGAKYNSKRIIVYKVFDEKSLKNKVKVCLIAWRQGVEVDGSRWS